MRTYIKEQACGFRYTRATWGAFSNFQPLAMPIMAGPWSFRFSESLYQAAKFAGHPDVQRRIAEAPTAREAAAIGRTPGLGIDPGWNAQRVDVMRWVLRMKREANAAEIDAVLAETGDRPIVEVSTRDPWWGARPVANLCEGHNVLGRPRAHPRRGPAPRRHASPVVNAMTLVPGNRLPAVAARAAKRLPPLGSGEGLLHVVTFYCPTPCSSLNPAKRRGPPLRFGLSQGPGRARAKIQARTACLGRAVKVADREVGLRELSTASCEARRPLKRGAGASAQRSLPPATRTARRPARIERRIGVRPVASMPSHNAAQGTRGTARAEPRARGASHRAAPRQARRTPTSAPKSATFRTNSRPRHPSER